MERLVAFQDMCLVSTERATHKVDGWMLRFLIEHSLDLEKVSSHSQELERQERYLRESALERSAIRMAPWGECPGESVPLGVPRVPKIALTEVPPK